MAYTYYKATKMTFLLLHNKVDKRKQNWNQFLLVVKITAVKQQISIFYPQIQRTDDSDHIYVS